MSAATRKSQEMRTTKTTMITTTTTTATTTRTTTSTTSTTTTKKKQQQEHCSNTMQNETDETMNDSYRFKIKLLQMRSRRQVSRCKGPKARRRSKLLQIPLETHHTHTNTNRVLEKEKSKNQNRGPKCRQPFIVVVHRFGNHSCYHGNTNQRNSFASSFCYISAVVICKKIIKILLNGWPTEFTPLCEPDFLATLDELRSFWIIFEMESSSQKVAAMEFWV